MPAPTKPDDQQTPPVQPQQGQEPPPGGEPGAGSSSTAGADNTGTGIAATAATVPDGISPEVKRYLDSELAKTRRSAEAEGRRKEREKIDEEARNANASIEQKLEAEKNKTTQLEQQLADSQKLYRKLEIALEVGLPNPQVNCKRLIDTDDEEALRADAESLKQSFGAPQLPAPPASPAVAGGGNPPQAPTNRTDDETVEKQRVAAAAQHPMYQSL